MDSKPVKLRVRRGFGGVLVVQMPYPDPITGDKDGTSWRDADADNPEEVAFVVEQLEKAK